jgi:hypothetical protein
MEKAKPEVMIRHDGVAVVSYKRYSTFGSDLLILTRKQDTWQKSGLLALLKRVDFYLLPTYILCKWWITSFYLLL